MIEAEVLAEDSQVPVREFEVSSAELTANPDFWHQYSDFLHTVSENRRNRRLSTVGYLGGNQDDWFSENQDPEWKALLDQFLTVRGDVLTSESFRDWLFEQASENTERGVLAWILLCRALSTAPSEEREQLFHRITSFFANLVNNSSRETLNDDLILYLRRANCLTTCSANYGAEAFIAAFGHWKIQDDPELFQAWKVFLETRVHPQIYTPQQFLRAAGEVFRKGTITEAQKQVAREIFGPTVIGEPALTPDPSDIYARTTLPYLKERGEAELPQDLGVIKRVVRHVEQKQRETKLALADFAAGTGRHVHAITQDEALRAQISTITAVDVTFPYLLDLERTDTEDVVDSVNAEWFHLPFEDGSFDIALLIGRDLPHLVNAYERRRFLSEARRTLSGDGVLLVDIPDLRIGEYRAQVDESSQLFAQWLPNEDLDATVKDTLDGMLFTLRVFSSLEQLLEDTKATGLRVDFTQVAQIPDSDAWNLYVALVPEA